jgi:hypothetical protein
MQSDIIRRLQPQQPVPDDEATFKCANCGAKVTGWLAGQAYTPWRKPRNSCTRCGWSAHVQFGTEARPPCGGLMRPRRVEDYVAVWRCVGCGFMMRGPTEEGVDRVAAGELESMQVTYYTEGSKFIPLDPPLPTPTALCETG